jgi:hypothetical protein
MVKKHNIQELIELAMPLFTCEVCGAVFLKLGYAGLCEQMHAAPGDEENNENKEN